LHKDFGANLSKELRKSTKKRSLSVRTGDKVKVARGKQKGKIGIITRISRRKRQVFIEGILRKKADGTEFFVPIYPANLLLLELSSDDKKRKIMQTKKKIVEKEATADVPKPVNEKNIAVVKK